MDDYSKVVEAGKGHNTVVAGENPGLRQVPIHNRGEPIENGAQDAANSDWSAGRVADVDTQPFFWKLDPQPITFGSWIRIRIKAMRIRNPVGRSTVNVTVLPLFCRQSLGASERTVPKK
jgi:hypothetical protein